MIEHSIDAYAGILLGSRTYEFTYEDPEDGAFIKVTTLAIYIPFIVWNISIFEELNPNDYLVSNE